MTLEELYGKVCGFAKARHAGQVREGTGDDYFNHPLAVAAAFDLKTQPVEKLAAVLHDTMEDCGVTAEEIIALAGGDARLRPMMEEVARAVELLTHRPCVTTALSPEQRREEYRKALAKAKSNPHSRLVKIADLQNNIATLGELPEPRQSQLRFKYDGAIEFMTHD